MDTADSSSNASGTIERLHSTIGSLRAQMRALRNVDDAERLAHSPRQTGRRWRCALTTLVHVQEGGERAGHIRGPRDDYNARQACAALALFWSYNMTNSIPCDYVLITDDTLSETDARALRDANVIVERVSLPPQRDDARTAFTHFEKVGGFDRSCPCAARLLH